MASYITDFAGLFTGHKNSYVVHVPPFTKNGNKVTASKVYYKKYQKSTEFVPLDITDYERHLRGEVGLAVSPLMGNNDGLRDSCYFACIDIDVYDSQVTIDQIETLMSPYPCLVKHSKSSGFHIFFFFKKMESAKEVRQELMYIRYILGLNILFKDRVEIFPEYDHVTDKKSHCLFLPFFGAKETQVKEFLREAKKVFTSAETLKKINESSRFNFLPVCIEAKLNAHSVESMSNRNNFLFSVATFLINTETNKAEDLFEEIGELFIDEDFTEQELETIYTSASTNKYSFLGRCKSSDLKGACDKEFCKERKFSDGSAILEGGKSRILTNVDFGQLYKYNALKPFYIWEMKKTGSEGDYVKVQFENIQLMLNQKTAQGIIGEAVDTIFLTLKNEIWEKHIEAALKSMITVEVNVLADSSDLALGVRMIYQFLLEQTTPYEEPMAVFQGRAYRRDDAYYFLIESVISYLYAKGYGTKKLNLYSALSSIGAQTAFFEGVEVWRFYENATFKTLVMSRQRIKEIEKRTLTLEIEARFAEKKKKTKEIE
jgi:hypothetical protein